MNFEELCPHELSHTKLKRSLLSPERLCVNCIWFFLFLVDHLLCHHEDDTKALLIILKVRNVCFSLDGEDERETVEVKLEEKLLSEVTCGGITPLKDWSDTMWQKSDGCVKIPIDFRCKTTLSCQIGVCTLAVMIMFVAYFAIMTYGICTQVWVFSSDSLNGNLIFCLHLTDLWSLNAPCWRPERRVW